MANFTVKTIKEVFNSLVAKYTVARSQHGDDSPLLEKSFVKSIFHSISAEASTLWQYANYILKQCFPQSCDLSTLKLWGGLVDVNYNEGKFANLTIQLNGVTADYLISGTIYKDLTSGLIYKTLSQVNAVGGVITTTAQCTTAGAVGNLAAGTVLTIANPVDGIPSTATVVNTTIEGTADEETETYRKRVLTRYKSKAQGGSALDYFNWCMEVPGVVDALPYVLNEGTVSIYLVGEGSGNSRNASGSISPNPFPVWSDGVFQDFSGSGLKFQVANSIEGSEEGIHDRRPMCAKVQILDPTYTAYSIAITGLSDTSFNQAIKQALISNLDSKRPHIKVLGYKLAGAKINKLALSSIVSEIIGDSNSFTGFSLKNSSNTEINEETLGVGCLAYLSSLTINGSTITL